MNDLPYYAHEFYKLARKGLMILLFGLAAWELFEAGKFFLVDMAQLDLQLRAHAVSEHTIQTLTASAIASSLSATINTFFAFKLIKAHEKLMDFVEVLTGSGLVVWHERMVEWLSTFNYVGIWERFF